VIADIGQGANFAIRCRVSPIVHFIREASLSAKRTDRIYWRHHRRPISRSTDPSRKERHLGRLDHDRQRNCGAQRQSVRAGTRNGAGQVRHSSPIDPLRRKRAKIKELVAQGKSLDEIRSAVGDPPPAAPGGRGPAFATFTEVVYKETDEEILGDVILFELTGSGRCHIECSPL
jgi:hypothetical protein